MISKFPSRILIWCGSKILLCEQFLSLEGNGYKQATVIIVIINIMKCAKCKNKQCSEGHVRENIYLDLGCIVWKFSVFRKSIEVKN